MSLNSLWGKPKLSDEELTRREKYRQLSLSPAFNFVMEDIKSRFIDRLPPVTNDEKGLYQAFAVYKQQHAIQSILDHIAVMSKPIEE